MKVLSPFDFIVARQGEPSTPRQLGDARMGIAGSITISPAPQPGRDPIRSLSAATFTADSVIATSGLSRYGSRPSRTGMRRSLIERDAKGIPRDPPNHAGETNGLSLHGSYSLSDPDGPEGRPDSREHTCLPKN